MRIIITTGVKALNVNEGMIFEANTMSEINTTTGATEQQEPQTGLSDDKSLRMSVRNSLKGYFARLGDMDPSNLYKMVLEEVETPLIKMVLQYTRGNQSRAAIILGMSRGTLRKKIAQYSIEDYNEID